MSPRLPRFRGLVAPLSLVLALGSACKKEEETVKVEPPKPSFEGSTPVGEEVVAQLDADADPCVDFYQFACGAWIERTTLPPDKPRWGRAGELGERNNNVLKAILEADQGRAGQFYASCMDEASINATGLVPLEPHLAKIDKLKIDGKKPGDLFKLMGELDAGIGLGVLFNFGLSIDFANPDLYIAEIGQGGTGLPDRSFYLDPAQKPVLDMYQAHIARMLKFTGPKDAPPDDAALAEAAARVVALETKLAELQKAPADMRDPAAVYNRWDRKGLEKESKLPWAAYFKALGYPKLQLINVDNPEFVRGLSTVLAEADPQAVKDYLRFHLISSAAPLLSDEVAQADFQLKAALTGATAMPPRWERCVAATNGAVGDLVSQPFVEQTFAGDSRAIALDMIKRIEAAFEAGLASLTWMDDATRTAAVGKMQKIVNQVGYPDRWKTYEGLEFIGAYFDDAVAARSWAARDELDKVGQPVDPSEWHWPASIVNAGYNPLQNQMLFPAGILQPPFFSKDFPTAMNFAAMGMVMGHELTHGFDDQGRKFDGDGVMREWWAPEVTQRYEAQTQCLVDTYGAIEIQPGVKLDGRLTLGENIADFGGIKEAHSAYAAWTAETGGEPAIVEGLTNQQLFFVAYAQSWCSISSPQFDALLAKIDPHSPPKQRVNVPLSHFPGFWEAFSCSAGTPMHAEPACSVW